MNPATGLGLPPKETSDPSTFSFGGGPGAGEGDTDRPEGADAVQRDGAGAGSVATEPRSRLTAVDPQGEDESAGEERPIHRRAVLVGKRFLDAPTGACRAPRDWWAGWWAPCRVETTPVLTASGPVCRLRSCGRRQCAVCAARRRRQWLRAVEHLEAQGELRGDWLLTLTPHAGWKSARRAEWVPQVRTFLQGLVRSGWAKAASLRVEVAYGGDKPEGRSVPCVCAAATHVEHHELYGGPAGAEAAAYQEGRTCTACQGTGKTWAGHVHVHALLFGCAGDTAPRWLSPNGRTVKTAPGIVEAAYLCGLVARSEGTRLEKVRSSAGAYVAKYLAKESPQQAQAAAMELRRLGVTREWSTMGALWGLGGAMVGDDYQEPVYPAGMETDASWSKEPLRAARLRDERADADRRAREAAEALGEPPWPTRACVVRRWARALDGRAQSSPPPPGGASEWRAWHASPRPGGLDVVQTDRAGKARAVLCVRHAATEGPPQRCEAQWTYMGYVLPGWLATPEAVVAVVEGRSTLRRERVALADQQRDVLGVRASTDRDE